MIEPKYATLQTMFADRVFGASPALPPVPSSG
jgi:hypothetical protein